MCHPSTHTEHSSYGNEIPGQKGFANSHGSILAVLLLSCSDDRSGAVANGVNFVEIDTMEVDNKARIAVSAKMLWTNSHFPHTS